MSDWADEKANYFSGWPGVFLSRPQMIGLAALFRQARLDALEEAARIADAESENAQMASIDFETDAAFSCKQVAERIRELKGEA